jgi:hypothetical protein
VFQTDTVPVASIFDPPVYGEPPKPTKTTSTEAYAKVNPITFFLSQIPNIKPNIVTATEVVIKLLVREGFSAMMTIGTTREAPQATARRDARI